MKRALGAMVGLLILTVVVTMCLWSSKAPPRVITGAETVSIYGQVVRQGKHPWKAGVSVRQLIENESGGFTQFANTKRIKVLDAQTTETRLRKAHKALYDRISELDDPLERAWEFCHLPGDAPSFDWLRPGLLAKAVVDFRNPQSDYLLEPDDVIIVDEMLITF